MSKPVYRTDNSNYTIYVKKLEIQGKPTEYAILYGGDSDSKGNAYKEFFSISTVEPTKENYKQIIEATWARTKEQEPPATWLTSRNSSR